MIKYIFLLLPFTIKAQDTAKYCFTDKQMDYWIGCSLDAKTYKNATDSLFMVLSYCNEDKRQLKGIIDDCNSLNKSYKKTLRKRNLALYLWQSLTALVGSAWVFREVKQLIN